MNNSESSTAPAAPDWLFEEVDTPSGWRLPYFLTQLNTMWPDLQDRLSIHVNTEQGVLNSMAFGKTPYATALRLSMIERCRLAQQACLQY